MAFAGVGIRGRSLMWQSGSLRAAADTFEASGSVPSHQLLTLTLVAALLRCRFTTIDVLISHATIMRDLANSTIGQRTLLQVKYCSKIHI